jgi:hypothetical protein
MFSRRRFLVVVLRGEGYIMWMIWTLEKFIPPNHHSGKDKIFGWHYWLGHPSFSYLQHLFPTLFKNILLSSFKCKDCILGKSHRTNYPISYNKCNAPFEIIHSNLWGPAPVMITDGFRWFVTFIDDCTRVSWVYVLKHNKDVLPVF